MGTTAQKVWKMTGEYEQQKAAGGWETRKEGEGFMCDIDAGH